MKHATPRRRPKVIEQTIASFFSIRLALIDLSKSSTILRLPRALSKLLGNTRLFSFRLHANGRFNFSITAYL